MPAGKFKLTTLANADITFTLPTPVTDPAVAELEAYRAKVEGAPVTYLVADVDNRKGADRVNMYLVSALDEKGREYTFSKVTGAIKTWALSYQADGTYLMPMARSFLTPSGPLLASRRPSSTTRTSTTQT